MKKNLLLLLFAIFAGAGCSFFTFPAPEPLPLSGTLWSPESAPPESGSARLSFLPDGRAGGRVGDNFFFGSVTISNGDEMRFGVLSVTSRPGRAGRYEKHFLSMLELTARYSINGDRLTLFDAEGRELLRFHGSGPRG